MGGDRNEPVLGRDPRARSCSELCGHSGGEGPTIRTYDRSRIIMVVVDGERYLVSMLGAEVDWVRNVRAAGGNVTLRHGRREEVHLEEVADDSVPAC